MRPIRHYGAGSGWKTDDGYILLSRPGHPNAHNNGNIFEHRFVMSEMLGRPLWPGENVHHKNGVRDDNRPENLELWIVSQPAGQRLDDVLRWVAHLAQRYSDELRALEIKDPP